MGPSKVLTALVVLVLIFAGCTQNEKPVNIASSLIKSRSDSIPANATKITPETDVYPPQLHSDEWAAPVPLGFPINSAGAEDSPFVTPDGGSLYFFFTPDVSVPVEKQLLDGVTGIYVSQKETDGKWSEPKRVVLQDMNKLSLDGCQFVQDNTIWFCSAREGYEGLNWFTAGYKDGKWQGWRYIGGELKQKEYEVGELHISADANELFFHSARSGGKGQLDIWKSEKTADGDWGEPENIALVNTGENEGWPYLSQDGKELWFLRFYQGSPALFRSKRMNSTFQEPELIISQFAGEPSLDNAGNIYFVHHFYNNSKMLEADIYVAYKK